MKNNQKLDMRYGSQKYDKEKRLIMQVPKTESGLKYLDSLENIRKNRGDYTDIEKKTILKILGEGRDTLVKNILYKKNQGYILWFQFLFHNPQFLWATKSFYIAKIMYDLYRREIVDIVGGKSAMQLYHGNTNISKEQMINLVKKVVLSTTEVYRELYKSTGIFHFSDEEINQLSTYMKEGFAELGKNKEQIITNPKKREQIQERFLLSLQEEIEKMLIKIVQKKEWKNMSDCITDLTIISQSLIDFEGIRSIYEKFFIQEVTDFYQESRDRKKRDILQKNSIESKTKQQIGVLLRKGESFIENPKEKQDFSALCKKYSLTQQEEKLYKYLRRIKRNGKLPKKSTIVEMIIKDIEPEFFEELRSIGREYQKEDQEQECNDKNKEIHLVEVEETQKDEISEEKQLYVQLQNSLKKEEKIECFIRILELRGYIFQRRISFAKDLYKLFKGTTQEKKLTLLIEQMLSGRDLENYKKYDKYKTFELNNGWRIIIEEDNIITKVLNHDEYMDYVKNNIR